MAVVPKSWLNNYVNNSRAAKPAVVPAPVPVPAPKNKNRKSRSKPAPRAVKRKPGFFRSLLGVAAGEALKGTGHVGQHVVKKIHGLHEMDGAGGLGGTPTNNASSGAVAGLGQPGSSEPGVKKKTKAPMMTYKMFKRTKGVK